MLACAQKGPFGGHEAPLRRGRGTRTPWQFGGLRPKGRVSIRLKRELVFPKETPVRPPPTAALSAPRPVAPLLVSYEQRRGAGNSDFNGARPPDWHPGGAVRAVHL